MLTTVLILIAGFVFLIKGADYLVKGASSLARGLGIRSFVIGLTVVAFGTSAPELVVNVLSATSDSTGLAIGNIFGSNIANILLILGVTAIISTVTLAKGTIWREIPFSFLAAVLVVIMGSDLLLDGVGPDRLARIDGLVLLAFFGIFLYYTYSTSKGTGEAGEVVEQLPVSRSVILVLGGLVGLVFGGKFIVDSAVEIATAIGISEHLIGLTVVAIGTSLPELATAVVGALKGKTDLVIGNVVGSNIFNIFFVLATTATIAPIPYSMNAVRDGVMLMVISALLFGVMFIGRKHSLGKWEGIAFLLIYISYIGLSAATG